MVQLEEPEEPGNVKSERAKSRANVSTVLTSLRTGHQSPFGRGGNKLTSGGFNGVVETADHLRI